MKKPFFLCALVALAATQVQAATDADIDNSFNPYRGGFPTAPGLSAGTVIHAKNADSFREVLGVGVYRMIKAGNFEITVGATTQFQVSKPYVDATRANMNKTRLGNKPGELLGYVAGRPFPEEPDLNDPRAGEKLAWNYKYGVNWGDGAVMSPFYWKYRNMLTGQVERVLKWDFHVLNFMHRTKDAPVPEITPNSSGVFRAYYSKAYEPQDIKNTQLLILRFEDDNKPDDAYLYSGFQRRVRRLAPGQTTDAYMGSDLMIEDAEGYNGRVSDMKWVYKGTKSVLLPMWNHNELPLANDMPIEPDGFRYVDFSGQGKCFLNGTWQLRKVYLLEATPVNPAHPLSKRLFYMDAQLASINGSVEIYDRKGDLWKVLMVGKSHADHHLPVNKGAGIGIDDAITMVDIQAKHCTTGQARGQVGTHNNSPSLFQVQNLRSGD